MASPGDVNALRTLVEEAAFEVEIKKSRFIAHAAPISSPADAMAFLTRASNPEATQNTWAYRVGPAYRFSDDGEPAGTAGRPILTAIQRRNIDRAMVVVTRFFGGIKLGAGGLVRAYGGAAAACLQRAVVCPFELEKSVEVSVGFTHQSNAYSLLQKHGLRRESERFDARGVVLTVLGAASAVDGFIRDLTEVTSGAARIAERSAVR